MSSKQDVSSDELARVAALVADASHAGGIPEAFATLIEGAVVLTGADRGAILLEREGSLVTCYADRGSVDMVGTDLSVDECVEGLCYLAGGAVISDDLSRDRRFEGLQAGRDDLSLLTLPLHLEGPPIGLVRLASGAPGLFGGREVTILRLLVAAMRKVLLQDLRAERETFGIREKDFAIAGVWALRDRRKVQLTRSAVEGGGVTLVRFEVRGYLTADIVHHISAVVRSSDHVYQEDAGSFTLILPATDPADAEIVARRVKGEVEKLAEMDGDPVQVDWTVRELGHDIEERRIA